MDKIKINYLSDLIYADNDITLHEIKSINDYTSLHIIAYYYNWDNGFEIPIEIMNHKYCDLGTALMLFYHADGYRLLNKDINLDKQDIWVAFIIKLYEKIINGDYTLKNIAYLPPITKVQIYKLKKINPEIKSIFLEKSPGIELEIPKI